MLNYLYSLWSILIDMSLWFLLGLFIAGLLHVFVRQGVVLRYVGGNNVRSVLWAALLGVPLPLCSCGVIPTGVSLRKTGASTGATVSFLIATPQTGVDSIGITWSLLGAPFAIMRPIVALISGVIGGVATTIWAKDGVETVAVPSCSVESKKQKNKLLSIVTYAFVEFLEDIALWLILGLLISAAIAVFVPNDFFIHYVDNYWLSMLLVLAIAVPLYVCATGSVPIAAVLIAKGLSPGAALVFLMAGPATNVATITVLAKTLGKRVTLIYVFTISVCAVLFGLIIDKVLPQSLFLSITKAASLHCHVDSTMQSDWYLILAAVIVSSLLIYHGMKKFVQRFLGSAQLAEGTTELQVQDISCNKCKAKIEQHLSQMEGIESVTASPSSKTVCYTGSVDAAIVIDAIEKLGYTVKK